MTEHLHMEILQCVLLGAESHITVLVEPQSERIPVCHQKPLTDVKLGIVHQQWTLWDKNTHTKKSVEYKEKRITKA